MDTDGLNPQAASAAERQRRAQQLVPFRSARLLRVLSRLGARGRDQPPVAEVTDRTIPGPGGELPIRVYRPEGETPFPTVVFFHGGGFITGDLDTHDALCRYLTRESGAVVVSVDYRLAPEHPFPAAAEDAIAATEWAAEHTRALGGTGALAVVGDSAGGNLAAVAALAARDRGGPDIDYQALIYPGVGVDRDQESVREYSGLVLSEDDWSGSTSVTTGANCTDTTPTPTRSPRVISPASRRPQSLPRASIRSGMAVAPTPNASGATVSRSATSNTRT